MLVPSRGSDQFNVRLPPGLRQKISELARTNMRSMNSEIVFHLEKAIALQANNQIKEQASTENKTAPESAPTL